MTELLWISTALGVVVPTLFGVVLWRKAVLDRERHAALLDALKMPSATAVLVTETAKTLIEDLRKEWMLSEQNSRARVDQLLDRLLAVKLAEKQGDYRAAIHAIANKMRPVDLGPRVEVPSARIPDAEPLQVSGGSL